MVNIQRAIEDSNNALEPVNSFEEKTGLKLASISQRICAGTIDLVIASIVFFSVSLVTLLIAIAATENSMETDLEGSMFWLYIWILGIIPMFTIIFLLSSVFYVIPELTKGRASIGKRIMKIHWVGEDGKNLKPSLAIFRVFIVIVVWILVATLNLFTFLYGFIIPTALYLGASYDNNKQTIYDTWSKAYLVEKKR